MDIKYGRAIYSLFGFFAVAMAWGLAHRLAFSRLQQLLVVIFAGLNPVYLYTVALIYPQSILALGYVAAIFLLTGEATRWASVVWLSLGLGAAFSLSLYASSISLFVFFPILAAYGWRLLSFPGGVLRGWSLAIVSGTLACTLLLGPYLWRNHTKVHPGIYFSLNSGMNLLLGNSPETTATSGVHVSSANKSRAASVHLGEYESNRILVQKALENIKSNPAHYAVLYLKKFFCGFNNSADTCTDTPSGSKIKTALAWIVYVVLAGGALLGFRSVWKGAPGFSAQQTELLRVVFLVIAVAYLMNIAGYAIFFTRLRFRVPLDLLLALPAAFGYGSLLRKFWGGAETQGE